MASAGAGRDGGAWMTQAGQARRGGSGAALRETAATHVALSPVSSLARAARVWGPRLAVVHGDRRVTYAALLDRSRRLASALVRAGVGAGEAVAALLPNIPEML